MVKKVKKRLDELLVAQGLAEDQDTASRLIMAGLISSNEIILDKPGLLVDTSMLLILKARSRYVSRGGEKLASVADELGLDFAGKVVLDVGASTGGFSDYALQHGAVKVYAVDVGRGQLSQKLQADERVVSQERTDIRELGEQAKDGIFRFELADVAVIDVSFVRLGQVLPAAVSLLKIDGMIVALMKPQFEASKAVAGKFKGVIDDENIRQGVIKQFEAEVGEDFKILGVADSTVIGTKGNRERFYVLKCSNG